MSSAWSSQVNLQVTWKILQVKNPKAVFTLTATKVRIRVGFPLDDICIPDTQRTWPATCTRWRCIEWYSCWPQSLSSAVLEQEWSRTEKRDGSQYWKIGCFSSPLDLNLLLVSKRDSHIYRLRMASRYSIRSYFQNSHFHNNNIDCKIHAVKTFCEDITLLKSQK